MSYIPDSGAPWFWACLSIRDVIIDGDFTSIPSGLVSVSYENFNSITINSSTIETIESGAFGYVTRLSEITIPDTVLTIENDAFFNTGLTDINIPSSVTNIGQRAFSYGTNAESVTINRKDDTALVIGQNAFFSKISSKTIDLNYNGSLDGYTPSYSITEGCGMTVEDDSLLFTNDNCSTTEETLQIESFTTDNSFDSNYGSGTMSDQTFTYGTAQNLTANAFTRTGYTFTGWNTTANGTGTAYENAQSVINPVGGMVLYAQWEPNVYTITWRDEDGTELGTTSVSYGVTPTFDSPSKAADSQYKYVFAGWYPSLEVVTGDAVYTATYTSTLNSYTVYFDVNGHGTAPSNQSVQYNNMAQKPDDPSATNYTFGGWYIDSACTSEYDFETPVVSNVTLYAKWTEAIAGDSSASSIAAANTKLTNTSDTKATYKVTYSSNGSVTVEYIAPTKKTKKVSIPSTATDANGNIYNVTAIAAGAFKGNKKIKNVDIPATVTKLEKNAFKNCKNLKKISFNGDSLTTVGKNALKGIGKDVTIIIKTNNKKKFNKIVNKLKKAGAESAAFKQQKIK